MDGPPQILITLRSELSRLGLPFRITLIQILDIFTPGSYFAVMEAQPQILTTLRSELPRLEALLKEQDDPGRNETARRVCQEFGFIDPRGHPRQAGCLKALRTLDAEKQIVLPAGQECAAIAKPRLLDAPVAKAEDVPDTARKVKDLRIIQVKSRQDRAIWNTLMDQEHPRGAAIFAGAQVKYLIHSAHDYLGGGRFFVRGLVSPCTPPIYFLGSEAPRSPAAPCGQSEPISGPARY